VVASAGDTTEVSAAARRQVDSTAVVLAPAGPTPRPGQPAPLTRPPPAAATAAGPAQQVRHTAGGEAAMGAAHAPRPGRLHEKLVKGGSRLLVSETMPAGSSTTPQTRPDMELHGDPKTGGGGPAPVFARCAAPHVVGGGRT
jgi:hypothetical protein